MDKMRAYDVFKGAPDKKPLWLGAVNGLPRALEQMKRMADRLPGDYFISDGTTHEILAVIQAKSPLILTTDVFVIHRKAS